MNIFNAPLPGTTLRTITEEWKVLSGFHALMRQRIQLEAAHLVQLRQLQDSIDSTWSKSRVWVLISPVIELWGSQMQSMEEFSRALTGIIESFPIKPSPDEPEDGIIPSSRYDLLPDPYKVYQDCRTAASSREAIAEWQGWFGRNRHKVGYSLDENPLPIIDRNYRESVISQRSVSRPIVEWHSKCLPDKLDAHMGYAEETQSCLRGYLVESSKFTSDFVKSISMAQKKLAEFSSLAFIDSSQKCFENESSHPVLQPAVYLNHYLGGVPAEPVLGVVSYLPKLMEVGEGEGLANEYLSVRRFLEAEQESTSFGETAQKLKDRFSFTQSKLTSLALMATGPLLPVSDDASQWYKNSMQRAQLLKPFPIENCQTAAAIIKNSVDHYHGFFHWARLIFGFDVPNRLSEDIWRKWDFDNHRLLPREVIRTLPEWNDDTGILEGGKLIIKKTGLPYDPLT